MRIVRNKEGLTLIETIITLLAVSLIVTAILLAASNIITQARLTTLATEARAAYLAAQIVIVEIPASDEDYASGLSGPQTSPLSPEAAQIARRFTELISPSVSQDDTEDLPDVLQRRANAESMTGTFDVTVENSIIMRFVYTASTGGLINATYEIVITHGGQMTAERIRS